MKKKEKVNDIDLGSIYGDTGKIEDKLQKIGIGNFRTKEEFRYFLNHQLNKDNKTFKIMIKYESFIYQSKKNLFVVKLIDIL